jgi:predicted nucleic acid-binding protein
MRINLFIDRNITIFNFSNSQDKGKKSAPQTLSKLLSAIISLFQELAEVIKEKGQISNIFNIEDIQIIDGKNFYIRTLRLIYVGQVYYNNDKIKEAYGLWSEAERCLKILNSKEEMNENKD